MNGLLRNPVDAFDPNIGEDRPLGHAYRENRLATGCVGIARDLHIIELPCGEDRADCPLNVAIVERRAAHKACFASDGRFFDVIVSPDRNGVRDRAFAGRHILGEGGWFTAAKHNSRRGSRDMAVIYTKHPPGSVFRRVLSVATA